MKWLETLQIVGYVIAIVATLFGWPLKKIIDNWQNERKENTKKLENLSEKVYDNEKQQSSSIHKHDVDIAELKSGKVSHEQMREAVTELREAMRSSVESISHQWEKARQQDREELRSTLKEIKSEIRTLRDKE
jgi:ArsR family metal-binding transcriptional regulator